MERLKSLFKGEPVLCISALCALASMFLTPPSAVYAGYIDFRVLILLFGLMAVVAGFQDCGLFELLAQRMLSGRHRMRTITLMLVLLPFFTSMLVTNDVALLTFVPFAILVLGKSLGGGNNWFAGYGVFVVLCLIGAFTISRINDKKESDDAAIEQELLEKARNHSAK